MSGLFGTDWTNSLKTKETNRMSTRAVGPLIVHRRLLRKQELSQMSGLFGTDYTNSLKTKETNR